MRLEQINRQINISCKRQARVRKVIALAKCFGRHGDIEKLERMHREVDPDNLDPRLESDAIRAARAMWPSDALQPLH